MEINQSALRELEPQWRDRSKDPLLTFAGKSSFPFREMVCINGHELTSGEERECPTCGEPSASLVAIERKGGLKRLALGIPLAAGPWIVAILLGKYAPDIGRQMGFLAIVFFLASVAGLVFTVSGINATARGKSVVKGRIKRSKEPWPMINFTCPSCHRENKGPFQNRTPSCYNCGKTIVGAICWRCGEQNTVEAGQEFRCMKCGQDSMSPKGTEV